MRAPGCDGRLQRVQARKPHRDCTGARCDHEFGNKYSGHPGRADRHVAGTIWEGYYRDDPEQNGGGNAVPTIAKLQFRVSGGANPANVGQGFLIDDVTLLSSNVPENKRDCTRDGWKTHTRADGSVFTSRRACIKYVKKGADGHAQR